MGRLRAPRSPQLGQWTSSVEASSDTPSEVCWVHDRLCAGRCPSGASAPHTSQTVTVTPGQSELNVTLAWDDVPGTPNVNPALVNDPDLVFLDEPTTGLDPQSRRNFWTLIAGIRQAGKTVLLTTH